ncbi:hypothetical protein CPC08DRAFT_770045 [Agrocybe pediades]|nr:hypothetical protein CPC08DRAFT_770045 [Agrocybe pediades]
MSDEEQKTRLHETLRVEWCSAKARRDRWAEEVQLLEEEMRRTLVSFERRSQFWANLATEDKIWMLPGVSFDLQAIEGRRAYTRQQSAQFKAMMERCKLLWSEKKAAASEENSQEDDEDAMPVLPQFDTNDIAIRHP